MLEPGSRIGIIGGGQLGQMIATAARHMGFQVGVLDPDPACPASGVVDVLEVASYNDTDALRRLATWADVLTYEFENVDADSLDAVAELAPLPQGTRLLRTTQDRRAERALLDDLTIPVAPYAVVKVGEPVGPIAAEVGYPCLLKTATGGYDGKGQVPLWSESDVPQAQEVADRYPCIIERLVDFEQEISVLVAGDGAGNYVTFPPVHNVHRDGILHRSTLPALVSEEIAAAAQSIAGTIAEEVQLAGVLAVEAFVTADGRVLVNELAPRPHNSGHATIEACDFSQYDLHVRGVAGWPLAQPQVLSPAVMVNLLGQHVEAAPGFVKTHPHWNLHLYGKTEARVGRKMGHLTAVGAPGNLVQETEESGIWQNT